MSSLAVMEQIELVVDITSSSDATIAIVGATVDGKDYAWSGTAKRHPGDATSKGDKPNLNVGVLLALGRALTKAGHQLERQGNGLVKQIDDNRRQASTKKTEAPKKRFRVRRPARRVSVA